MFDHVTIRVSDREASDRFYDTVLPVLGKRRYEDDTYTEWGDLSIVPDDQPRAERLHMAFSAATHEHVDAFHQAGVDAGYTSDGAPGPRPHYTPSYYGAFLLDPDGHSVEAVYLEERQVEPGQLDHLMLRTQNLEAITAFYTTIAPVLGYEIRLHSPDHTQVRSANGSFSFVTGTPVTRNVHIAFEAADDATVDAFHAAATGAGFRDNGAPGERLIYHPGYYGAFVLDPDGHNIEAVNHNR